MNGTNYRESMYFCKLNLILYCFIAGAIQASLSSVSAIGELVSTTMLLAIYSATVEYYYGAVYLVTAGLVAICLSLEM